MYINLNFCNYATFFLEKRILPSLTVQQKRILFVASIALSCLAMCYAVRRCWVFKLSNSEEKKASGNENIDKHVNENKSVAAEKEETEIFGVDLPDHEEVKDDDVYGEAEESFVVAEKEEEKESDLNGIFSKWLENITRNVPEKAVSSINTLESLRSVLETHKIAIVRSALGGLGLKLNIEHIVIDESYKRTLQKRSIVAVVCPTIGGQWTMYGGSEPVEVVVLIKKPIKKANLNKKVDEDDIFNLDEELDLDKEVEQGDISIYDSFTVEEKIITSNIFYSCHTCQFDADLTEAKRKMFSETEQQNLLPEEDQSNLAWLLYRLLSGRSAMLVERKMNEIFPNLKNPVGYWKVSLGTVQQ